MKIMKNFKTNIFLFAMLVASPLTVSAQADDDAASADSTVAKKKVHVAFRGRTVEERLYDE